MIVSWPETKYDVLYIDPPWSYYGQQDKWGAAAKFYPLMSDIELLGLPIQDLVVKSSVCFLWATGPRLDFAIDCMRAWGFQYRGVSFVWVKTRKDGTPIGAQGVRPSIVKPLTEFVLVGSITSKGRPMPLADESIVQTVFAPRGNHSSKPEEVRYRIERLYPNASRLEMFSRTIHPGWDSWGNEVEGGFSSYRC